MKNKRYTGRTEKTVLMLLLIFTLHLTIHANTEASIRPCNYDNGTTYTGMGCGYGGCLNVSADIHCETWKGTYPYTGKDFITYIAYIRRYDCDGDSSICKAGCWGTYCGAPTMGECMDRYEEHMVFESVRAMCDAGSWGAGGGPPSGPCETGDVCCAGGSGGGGGGGGGSGGGGGGGSPLFRDSGPNLNPHSPAPVFNFRYDHKYKVDRGMGMGWSHTYMYSLEEDTGDNGTGNVAAYTQTGGFPWIYLSNGDGTYEAAPYDRTVLVKDVDTFIATGKDGTRYIYNEDNGSLEKITDLNNNSLTMEYTDDLLETVSDDFGRSLELTYDGNDHLESVTDPNGNKYTFSYQAAGEGGYNLTSVEYPDNSTKQFEYNDPSDPHNLTRVIDNNGNVSSRFEYDKYGRIVSKDSAGGAGIEETDYTPATEVFSDDFDNGISSEWTSVNGTVDVVADPDGVYDNQVVRVHPGSMSYESDNAVEKLKVSFDLWINDGNTGNFTVNIYNGTEGQDYGPWINFTSSGEINAELLYDDDDNGTFKSFILDIGALSPLDPAYPEDLEGWHRIEIEADTKEYYTYFKIWADCEYLGGHPFKRDTLELDTVKIDASLNGRDIYIDNFEFEKVTMGGSKRVITDSSGGRKTITVIKDNEFGGESWQIETRGKSGGSCSSCSSNAKLYEYDDKWNLRRTIDGNGTATEMTYDSRGNMLKKTEAKGTTLERRTTWTWHTDFNKPLTETRPSVDSPGDNMTITYGYDANGNLLSETTAGYSNSTPFSYTTSYTYNSRGQGTEIDGPRTDVSDNTTYSNDPTYGYLNSITYPNGTVNYSGYDANHNVGSTTDLNGVDTDYTYDYRDRLKTITVGTAVTEYFYDPVGNIDYVRMPEDNIIDYDYDEQNQLVEITDDIGNYISYEYDDMGNKIREEYHDDNGTITKYLDFEYDHFSRLYRIENPDNSYTQFGYDNNTNRTSMIDPLGTETEYEHDELGRMTKVTQAKGLPEEAVTEHDYDAHDNLKLVKDAEGKQTTYRYDDAGRLIETVSPDNGTTTYVYDGAGNLTSKTDAKGTTANYEYDRLNRLTKVDFPDDYDDMWYKYDETTVSNGIGRLTTFESQLEKTQYSYDERGNIVQQTVDSKYFYCCGTLPTFYTVYSYNLNNQLTGITYPDGTEVEYTLNNTGNITDVTIDAIPVVTGMDYESFGGLKEIEYSLNSIQTSINRKRSINRIFTTNLSDVIVCLT